MSRTRHILCMNSGSSSLKLALFAMGTGEERLAAGALEHIGLDDATLRWQTERAEGQTRSVQGITGHAKAFALLLQQLGDAHLPTPDAIGHRIVHGGMHHSAPEQIDAELLASLNELIPLAPLHLPGALTVIRDSQAAFRDTPQVACYDTAFHHRMPELARRLPLPRTLWDQGIRRYGFHGLSYEYILAELGEQSKGRLVVAHLGNGASLAAIRDGQPVDTTMGLTPTGGIMMGTRSGDLDPGVLIHLLDRGYDSATLRHLTEDEAGLLGVSGISRNMQDLLARRAHEPDAAQAVDMFCYQVRKTIGAYAAALGGLDTLVFTAGIGERADAVRAAICDGLEHLGVRVDPARNAKHDAIISPPDAPCSVRVVATDEDRMLARHTHALLFEDA